jgi:hypothetical protein
LNPGITGVARDSIQFLLAAQSGLVNQEDGITMEARRDMAEDNRMARLAKQIDSDLKKDQHLLLTEIEVVNLRRQGASELHSICSDFVASLNRLLSPPVLELTPREYSAEMFRESGVNLIQINAQGRILQIVFEATREIYATEKFRIPYILEGEVRAYNQEMLERTQIQSRALFFCLERDRNTWRYFEWLHGRTGVFGRDQLASLLERLV